MHSFDINIENLTKVEGHANLDVRVRDDKVEYVKLQITENQRFYEQAVRGQPITTAPQLMSRICGTCSIAHMTCCIEAIENAVGIEPTEQALLMKKLAMYGLMIRDHALHLYFFSLPDLIGKDSILDFDEKNEREHKLLHDSFDLKRAGNTLSTLVAGKAVHAPYPTVGGFLHTPDEEGVKKAIKELRYVRPLAIDLIDTFFRWDERFDRETDFVALATNDYSFLEGEIKSSRGICIKEKDYLDHLIRVIIPYSQASGFEFEGEEFMVGALSRLNLNKGMLHPETKDSAREYVQAFPSTNIFHNNVAQAIEILHSIDHSIELLETASFHKEELQKTDIKEENVGVGVIEAPRGTLYYRLTVGKSGKIKKANVVVPTAQNQINIEKDIAKLVQDSVEKLPKEKIEYEIEKLLRAYDPCLSCASHFLKVKWL
ncbi:MAG: Ni/Fe hydrogenase subunit alpha [Candidatus Aenigmarchaeota archaeon]|nr:Ni/Fe hydrogenase subunit alpha [Candidatus Aenigmarchaeota archaeon]